MNISIGGFILGKFGSKLEVQFLVRSEIEAILAAPDRRFWIGRRLCPAAYRRANGPASFGACRSRPRRDHARILGADPALREGTRGTGHAVRQTPEQCAQSLDGRTAKSDRTVCSKIRIGPCSGAAYAPAPSDPTSKTKPPAIRTTAITCATRLPPGASFSMATGAPSTPSSTRGNSRHG